VRLAILGAGSWGTALAIEFARSGHDVVLWGRDDGVARTIAKSRRHPKRLEGHAIPASVRVTSDIAEAVDVSPGQDRAIFLTVPCVALPALVDFLPARPDAPLGVVNTSKGIEPETLRRMSEIVLGRFSKARVAALSGPTFAEGVARGDPSAAVVASRDGDWAATLQRELSSSGLRLYRSDDLAGVELAGALKNVVAIAAGIVSGLGFGPNTLAALVTRGLTEIGRIVRGNGGQDRTVHGLAGVGDLMLTCTGQQSRNRFVGEQIGRGRRLHEILAELPEVAEGARTCLAVPRLAAAAGVEAPIADAVVQVLYGDVAPRAAVESLMTRALRSE
jgi:glycerol-3-phosphate dehydrogenase (NAD(P)+)